MKEQFVPYEESLRMKKLGFDKLCFGFYHKSSTLETVDINVDRRKYEEDTLAPLWQQAFDWFRVEYKVWADIRINKLSCSFYLYQIDRTLAAYPPVRVGFGKAYETYEDARLNALVNLIALAENDMLPWPTIQRT